jgi:Prokaryotic Cytochrome C oxidase subunit IV
MATLVRTWAVLVALTLAAMWVAASELGGQAGLIARAVLVVITVLKAAAVLRNFLELKHAPSGWQFFFYGYLMLLGALIFAAFALSDVLA